MPGHAPPTRIACLGDSITEGFKLDDPDRQAYPAQLQNLLGSGYGVERFAAHGRTMLRAAELPLWDEPQFHQAIEFAPHVAVILLGTNDSSPKTWPQLGERFEADYHAMVERFESLPTRPRVVACLPPPMFLKPGNVQAPMLLEGVLPAIERVVEDRQLTRVDLHTPLLGAAELFPDTVHPDARGAARIAELVHVGVAASLAATPAADTAK